MEYIRSDDAIRFVALGFCQRLASVNCLGSQDGQGDEEIDTEVVLQEYSSEFDEQRNTRYNDGHE